MKTSSLGKYERIINKGTMNIIIFACVIIVIAILATGISSYIIVKNAMIEKLQKQDLVYILKSISAQIDDRIDRAKETSLILADNPEIIQWFQEGETDENFKKLFIKQMTDVAKTLNYTVFFTNRRTGHYWTNSNLLTDTMSKDNISDRWFYDTLASGRKITLNIDHNVVLNQTNLWINTLMGDPHDPAGVAGVGVDLQDISKEFGNYKIGNGSNLWLIDTTGKISISDDVEQSGGRLSEYLPAGIFTDILKNASNGESMKIVSYVGQNGRKDLVYQKLKSCNWILVFQINRSETLGLLNSIMVNTLVSVVIVLIFLILVFYTVSSKIANPYKKTLQLNLELENEIEERTTELREQNSKMTESIYYAKTIQESILPSSEVLQRILGSHFVLWRPRDLVGGDFYWLRETKIGWILVVGDCTGHGVPGALMTMAVNSILSNIVSKNEVISPTDMIKDLNHQLKDALNKEKGDYATDDGLDAAILSYENSGRLLFAGAKMNMYVASSGQMTVYEGHRNGIGYIKSIFNDGISDTIVSLRPGVRVYLTTDGYVDQNGGPHNYSFSKRRFRTNLLNTLDLPITKQGEWLENELTSYQGQEPQRDDITVLGIEF
ncbi:SpoIIE family protein phosphatase [Desulfosporosinus sp. FKA]|uniref:SpoIIE family protein phosphatase n=1 Tax=Desulfosporosinus sp. FKA TaxID=1969834 RepID=UPI000B4A535C|nr:SpoIIE family protein phosphatase [Desulfosporosinus sp. FKA]